MSQHQFSPSATQALTPSTWYQQVCEQPGFQGDKAQAAAVARLQALHEQLIDFQTKRDRFLGRSLLSPLLSPDLPRGLYLWGGVGRGKSLLMDMFYSTLPYRRKRRVHFHAFMQDIHRLLAEQKHAVDPLQVVAAKIAKSTRVLCFDEFHVSDIADAMILARLLTWLFEYGVVLVLTSNYPPDRLYPDGLQRENFLPAIALLKAKLDVINVDGGNDYRLRQLERTQAYRCPDDAATQIIFRTIFDQLTTGRPLPGQFLLNARPIKAIHRANGVVWFDFATLCAEARGQADYLEIARQYHTVFLTGVPKMTASMASEARRFTWLIDVFYDNRVKLFIAAAVAAHELYVDGVNSREFFRTESRLQEMQSKTYMALGRSEPVESFNANPPG